MRGQGAGRGPKGLPSAGRSSGRATRDEVTVACREFAAQSPVPQHCPPRSPGVKRLAGAVAKSAVVWLPIRRSVLVNERPIPVEAHHVDIGARRQVVEVARTDLEVDRDGGTAVLQVMSVAQSFRERS